MIGKGFLAGLVATIVLSALMVMKAMMGLMPALDLPQMLAAMMGSPTTPMVGWVVHFLIGIVAYGIAIALLDARLPGSSSTWHGVLLAVAGWLVMVVVLMPMAGAGRFGMTMGPMAPVMTLVLHLIFGAVLGWTYGRLVAGTASDLVRRNAASH
ncbi:MAG: DUF6789 family protein [Burkholderiaceae bacterium]